MKCMACNFNDKTQDNLPTWERQEWARAQTEVVIYGSDGGLSTVSFSICPNCGTFRADRWKFNKDPERIPDPT